MNTSQRNTINSTLTLLAALLLAPLSVLHAAEFDVADIAPSAYQYRADRKAEENAPESWLAVMRFAGQPLNKPADTNSPAVKRVLCALLWEEIRPIRQVELTWPADEKRIPATEAVEITTLDNQGTASSWWNNLKAEKKLVTPTSADGGSKLVYRPVAQHLRIGDQRRRRQAGRGLCRSRRARAGCGQVEEDGHRNRVGLRRRFRAEGLQRPHRDLRRHRRRTGAVGWRCRHDGWRPQLVALIGQGRRAPRGEGEPAVHGHFQMAKGDSVHQSAGRRGAHHRHGVEQVRQLLVPGRGPRERPDPRAGVWVLRPADIGMARVCARSSRVGCASDCFHVARVQDGQRTGQHRSPRLGTSRFALVRGQSRRGGDGRGNHLPGPRRSHASWQRLRRGGGMEEPVRRRDRGARRR